MPHLAPGTWIAPSSVTGSKHGLLQRMKPDLLLCQTRQGGIVPGMGNPQGLLVSDRIQPTTRSVHQARVQSLLRTVHRIQDRLHGAISKGHHLAFHLCESGTGPLAVHTLFPGRNVRLSSRRRSRLPRGKVQCRAIEEAADRQGCLLHITPTSRQQDPKHGPSYGTPG